MCELIAELENAASKNTSDSLAAICDIKMKEITKIYEEGCTKMELLLDTTIGIDGNEYYKWLAKLVNLSEEKKSLIMQYNKTLD